MRCQLRLEDAVSRAQQRAQEECVFRVLVAVLVGINPPATAQVADVAGTEHRCQAGWADTGLELLKTPIGWKIGKNDGVIEKPLGFHVDSRARTAAGGSLLREYMRSCQRGTDNHHGQACKS
jgi:hypothetical protein